MGLLRFMSASLVENEYNNMVYWGTLEGFGGHLTWALVKVIIMFSLYYIIILKLPSERKENKY